MQSSKPNGEFLAIIFLLGCLRWAFIIVYALVVVLATFLTVVCIIALFDGVTIGDARLEPHEALLSLMLGCGGGLIVVVMAMIFQAWSETRIPSSFWPHFYVIGYLIGFFGPALVEDDLPQPPMRDITPAHDLPDAPLVPLPKPNAPPFRFAEWDDEELR